MRKLKVDVVLLEKGSLRMPLFVIHKGTKYKLTYVQKPTKTYYDVSKRAEMYQVSVQRHGMHLYNDRKANLWFIDYDSTSFHFHGVFTDNYEEDNDKRST